MSDMSPPAAAAKAAPCAHSASQSIADFVAACKPHPKSIKSADSNVSVVLTSCGRFDLLRQTLHSFFAHNTYPFKDFIIVEDSPKATADEARNCAPEALRDQLTVVHNHPQRGQITAIDKAYALVKSEFVFHCEDDWLFYRPGFIEDSLPILKADPHAHLVWLRSHWNDFNEHTAGKLYLGERRVIGGVAHYPVLTRKERNDCLSFNPGLRRMADVPKEGYGTLQGHGDFADEWLLSDFYQGKGFYSVLLENSAIKHLGDTRGLPKNLKKRRKQKIYKALAVAALAAAYFLGKYQ